jgi:aldehyde dehydrogenase (NAD+)
MTIYREEIFGPVLSILPFEDEEHAIEMANDTEYGLTNYIQTTDQEKLRRVARRVRSGMVEGNGKGFGQGSPSAGSSNRGTDARAVSFGLHEFTEIKAVSGWE